MSRLSSYKSSVPSFQQLPEGTHTVRLVSYKETNSSLNYDGTPKASQPEYVDTTEQLAITVVSVDGKGSMTHRLNAMGYLKYEKLTDKEIKSGKFSNIRGYACAKNKNGQLERIVDETNTAACDNIIDQFMNAVGMGEGSSIDDLRDEAIAKQTPFNIVVVNDEYDGKDQYRIKSFKKVSVEEAVETDLER